MSAFTLKLDFYFDASRIFVLCVEPNEASLFELLLVLDAAEAALMT